MFVEYRHDDDESHAAWKHKHTEDDNHTVKKWSIVTRRCHTHHEPFEL